MSEMNIHHGMVSVTFSEFYDLVMQESVRQAKTIKVSKNKLVESLKVSIAEIETKHKEAMDAWKKTVEIYAEFIKQNPGSTQMKAPALVPIRLAELEDIYGFIKMFNATVDDELTLELSFLMNIFSISTRAIYSATVTRDNYVQMATGSMVFANSLNLLK